jgi:hypothetical protein
MSDDAGTEQPTHDPPPLEFPDAHCPQCDYNLHGLSPGPCPECGVMLRAGDLVASQIPWVHRHRIGGVRAFLGTLHFITSDLPTFLDELDHPVNYEHARRFRAVCVWIAFGSYLLLAAVWARMALARGAAGLGVAANLGIIAGTCVLVWLWLIAITRETAMFFHPRSVPVWKQNRGIALSCYACMPLAVTPLPAVLTVVAINNAVPDWVGALAAFFAIVLTAAVTLKWLYLMVRITVRFHPRPWRRGVAVVLGISTLWAASGLALFGGAALVIIFVGAVMLSTL